MRRTMTTMVLFFFCGILHAAQVVQDQFGTKHTLPNLLKGTTLILIGGDGRDMAKKTKAWSDPLRTRLGTKVRIMALANIQGLPFFVPRSSVTGNLKKQLPNVPVLCDWDGKAYRSLGLARGKLTVRVYGPQGKLRGQVVGQYSAAGLKRVLALVGK